MKDKFKMMTTNLLYLKLKFIIKDNRFRRLMYVTPHFDIIRELIL